MGEFLTGGGAVGGSPRSPSPLPRTHWVADLLKNLQFAIGQAIRFGYSSGPDGFGTIPHDSRAAASEVGPVGKPDTVVVNRLPGNLGHRDGQPTVTDQALVKRLAANFTGDPKAVLGFRRGRSQGGEQPIVAHRAEHQTAGEVPDVAVSLPAKFLVIITRQGHQGWLPIPPSRWYWVWAESACVK